MPPLTGAPFGSQIPLMPVIERAKAMLEKETVSVTGSGKSTKRELKLAVADFRSGEIRIVKGLEQDGNLSLDDSSIRFELDWWNGFNSSISIHSPAQHGVVALLYPLAPDRQAVYKQDAIIYTPFSSALLQTELIEAGRKYLIETITKARRELSSVPSRAFAGTSVGRSPAFTDDDYLDLILSEHMDPGRFGAILGGSVDLKSEQERQLMLLAARILVIIGANQQDAYRFTGSSAGAQGISQFTRMGMRVVWDRYPGANMPTDLREAATIHANAVKAQMCLMDSDLGELRRVHPQLSDSGYEKYAAAAAYNGGQKRVRYGLGRFGIAWLRPRARLTELTAKAKLSPRERQEMQWLKVNRNKETFVYLNKIHLLDHSPLRAAWNQPQTLFLALHSLLFAK
jgi:hypothetical protein